MELRDGQVVDATLYQAPHDHDQHVRFFILRLSFRPHAPVTDSLLLRTYDLVRTPTHSAYDRSNVSGRGREFVSEVRSDRAPACCGSVIVRTRDEIDPR
jgi:hypothetical protein